MGQMKQIRIAATRVTSIVLVRTWGRNQWLEKGTNTPDSHVFINAETSLASGNYYYYPVLNRSSLLVYVVWKEL